MWNALARLQIPDSPAAARSGSPAAARSTARQIRSRRESSAIVAASIAASTAPWTASGLGSPDYSAHRHSTMSTLARCPRSPLARDSVPPSAVPPISAPHREDRSKIGPATRAPSRCAAHSNKKHRGLAHPLYYPRIGCPTLRGFRRMGTTALGITLSVPCYNSFTSTLQSPRNHSIAHYSIATTLAPAPALAPRHHAH
jgi:hypothetical protein